MNIGKELHYSIVGYIVLH